MSTPPLDLTSCEREPIRTPGSIQPHGCLIACDMASWMVTHASKNAAGLLGLAEGEALPGRLIDDLLPHRAIHDLRNTLQASMVSGAAEILANAILNDGRTIDIALHASGDAAIIELLPGIDAQALTSAPMTLVRSMLGRLKRANTLERAMTLSASQIRAVTGYDRVMIYQFLEDGSGEVIAEALRAGLTPFLGLRYPASDIPAQARELYKRQWIRLIPDVFYEPCPIVTVPDCEGEAPLDLSMASLRSVSPIHIEYLKNMGTSATMTISLMYGKELWGLIACHHQAPRLISTGTAAACELFGQIFSIQIEAMVREKELSSIARSRDAHERLSADMPPEQTLFDNIARYEGMLRDLIPCDGIGVWTDGVFSGVGLLPPVDAMPELIAMLNTKPGRHVYATNKLDSELPSTRFYRNIVSGLIAIPFSREPRDYLLFFRRELLQVVNWGGNPNKPVESVGAGTRIGPRKSFASWREEVSGQSQPWLRAEVQIAEALRVSLLEVILRRSDMVDRKRRSAQESQSLLIAELNHRVKNILALIRSLVRQSQHGAVSIASFTADLEQRIRALSFAHDQMTQSGWTAAPLRRLLEAEAKAWARAAIEAITFDGPSVMLDSRAYQTLALVFHELMTNAAKYGSLSHLGGYLSVQWSLSEEGALTIEWQETGGPAVKAPTRRGFGSVVVEQTIPFELQGEAHVDFRADGLRARFLVPALHVTVGPDIQEAGELIAPSTLTLAGKRLLLVEDSMMIALDAQAALQEAGVTVDVAGTVPDALRAVTIGQFDAVVLDINLSGETSFGVADRCVSKDVPFVFATGYGESVVIPDRFKAVPVVAKPYDEQGLRTALEVATTVTD